MTAFRLMLLGDPVDGSRSPMIHTHLLKMAGLEGEYTALRADRDVLQDIVDDLRLGKVDGVNITMPLKGAAAGLCDDLAPTAALSGSVNTLVAVDGSIVGSSTDSDVFAELFSNGFAAFEQILVLGSGATARAALAVVGERRVYLSARNQRAAADLAAATGATVVPFGAAVADALVVNTTPIGMKDDRLPKGIIEVAGGLIDLPYSDVRTQASSMAMASGIPVIEGGEFLLRQALRSFNTWTGVHVGFEAVAGLL